MQLSGDMRTGAAVRLNAAWFSRRVPGPIRPRTAAELHRFMRPIRDDAERLAPVDEGDLASTVRYEVDAGSLEATLRAGGMTGSGAGKLVDYALPVETGHATVSGSWVPPQSYLRAAIPGGGGR